jgi:uncharacterized protein (TIGR00251 family)
VSFYRPVQGGIEIEVLVVPRASRSRIAGLHEDRLKIQLSAPPVEGAANEALIELLADHLGVKKKSVVLVAGQGSRRKRVRVEGASEDAVRALVHDVDAR